MADDVLDSDTRRTLAAGRQSIGEVVVAARSYARRLFVVFVVGLLGTIYAMQAWIWPILKADLLVEGASVVAITPFDVILLQAKIGIVVGILMMMPPLFYYSREPLKRRGWWPAEGVATWKLVGIVLVAVALFVVGVAYAYYIIFPFLFGFLARNAIQSGLTPNYSIVYWTQFIILLALSFGLAAQLPLAMTSLAYADVVPYETFREKWKYAVLGMFVVGTMINGTPEPFSATLVAAPMIVLYGIGLACSRLVETVRQGRKNVDLSARIRARWNVFAGVGLAVLAACYWAISAGVGVYVNEVVVPAIPPTVRPPPVPTVQSIWGLPRPRAALATSVVIAVTVVLLTVVYYVYRCLVAVEQPEATSQAGEPGAIAISDLDAEGVRAAPPEAFEELSEDEVLAHARAAMDADEPEKAQAIFDRYDEVEVEADREDDVEATGAAGASRASGEAEDSGAAGGLGGTVQRTTAGVVDAFTEDDTTEEDIGGYYYDLAFILESLRSVTFRIFAVFLLVLVSVFVFLYQGGFRTIKRDFLTRLPEIVQPEEVNVITLHPVEALVFEIKIATLLGAVATLPLLLYYAWPALQARGIARGNRNVFFGWAGAIFLGLIAGSALGYLYVAPAVVSYFVWDALSANMIIAYRVSNFAWLVFFTTVGIGLLADIPVTMLLFHRGGIVSYRTMRERWRVVTLGVMVFAAVFTPASVLSMILVAIPVMFAYAFGLGVLWVYTFGGRRAARGATESG